MNDLITAATSGLFVEVGKVIEHMKVQQERIADLERQLAEASAPSADVMMATAQRLIAEVNAANENENEKNLTVRGIGWMHSELLKGMADAAPSAPSVEPKGD